MMRRSEHRLAAFVVPCIVFAVAFGSPFRPSGAARADELRVVAGGGLAGAFAELGPSFEKATGHKLVVFYGAVPEMVKHIADGSRVDVVVAPPQVMKNAAVAGHFTPGPWAHIGSLGYGVALRSGAPKPDVGTPDSLKATLLKAKSVTFVPNSAAGGYVMKVFERLGIAAEMKAKTHAAASATAVQQAIKDGDAELGIYLLSVFAVPGIEIAGALPPPLQNALPVDGAVVAGAEHAAAARKFIEFLMTPQAVTVLSSKGITPG